MNRLIPIVRTTQRLATTSNRQSHVSVFDQRRPRSWRYFSTEQEPLKENLKDKAKIRRMYVLGGCLVTMYLASHGVLLYRRRSEHRKLDAKLPPLSFEEFSEKYIASGSVKSIVYQPQFGTGNVYLHSEYEQKVKNTVANWLNINAPDKFSRPPDVRFYFDGDQKEVEKAIIDSQKAVTKLGGEIREIEFSVDQFPSYSELSFIVISTLFTLVAITMMK